MALTYDFEKFNKTGLKKVTAYFDKQGLSVEDVTGDNKPKRENGFQVKTAEITFESGQKLVMKAKADGNVYQWRLNGKVLAIKNYHTIDTAIVEVTAFIKENEPIYQKNKAKALEKVKVKVDIPKPVNTTVQEQTTAFQASLDALTGQIETAKGELALIMPNVSEKEAALAELQSQIAVENDRTTELEAAIEKAKQGIFESAEGEQDPTEAGIFEAATKCEYCGASMGKEDHRCMACGKTPEQAHELASKRGIMEAAKIMIRKDGKNYLGPQGVVFVSWKEHRVGAVLVALEPESRSEFGPGVFRFGKGEIGRNGEQSVVKLDPKKNKVLFLNQDKYLEGDVVWDDSSKIEKIIVLNPEKFNAAFGTDMLKDAVMESAEEFEENQDGIMEGTNPHFTKVKGGKQVYKNGDYSVMAYDADKFGDERWTVYRTDKEGDHFIGDGYVKPGDMTEVKKIIAEDKQYLEKMKNVPKEKAKLAAENEKFLKEMGLLESAPDRPAHRSEMKHKEVA